MARLMIPDLAGCWFSFKGDQACLAESVRAFRGVYGQDVPICVFDDRDNPMDADFVATLGLSLYVLTPWERRGNLNGRDCVLGILACLELAGEATGARWIAKTDCDTIIFRPWADLLSTAMFQGIYWWPRALATGCSYVFRRGAPGKLRSWILTRDALATEARWAEDATISFYAAVVFSQGVAIRHDGATAKRRIAGGWGYRPGATFEIFRDYCVANFGDRYRLPEDWTPDRKRAEVAATMASFNEWVAAGFPRMASAPSAGSPPGQGSAL